MIAKRKIFHVITKLELGGAQKVTLMTLERLPRDRYELGLVTGPEGLLVEWANRIPALQRDWKRKETVPGFMTLFFDMHGSAGVAAAED